MLATQGELHFAFSLLNILLGTISNPDPLWQEAKVLMTAIPCVWLGGFQGAHLDVGRVENCVELETRHKCVLTMVFSEFQS